MFRQDAYTITELLISAAIIIIFFASALGVFVTGRTLCLGGIAAQGLQRDADWIMDRMVRGVKEGGARYGLRSAVSFTPPASVTTIDFTGTDGNVREYSLVSGGIAYRSPAQTPNTRTIYTAPPNATVILRFQQPAGHADNETLSIYIGITQRVSGRTVSGSATTYVNLRNIPIIPTP